MLFRRPLEREIKEVEVNGEQEKLLRAKELFRMALGENCLSLGEWVSAPDHRF